jgi:hypothetical protein
LKSSREENWNKFFGSSTTLEEYRHYAIREGLERAHIIHKFERVKGQIIFPNAAEFRRGLGDARISVCFPSSITNPEMSGQVETVTLRYFESLASRCVGSQQSKQ